MPKYQVIGNAVYMSGFDLIVTALDQEDARIMVEESIKCQALMDSELELQEVCFNEINEVNE